MDGWLWKKRNGIGAAAAALAAAAVATGALVLMAPAPDGRGELTALPAATAVFTPDDEDEFANASLGLESGAAVPSSLVGRWARIGAR